MGSLHPCSQSGRSFDQIEVSITPKAELDRDLAHRYADLGGARLIVSPRARDVNEMLRAAERVSRELIGKV